MGDTLSSIDEKLYESKRNGRKQELKRLARQIENIEPFSNEYDQVVFLIENMDKIWRNKNLIKLLG